MVMKPFVRRTYPRKDIVRARADTAQRDRSYDAAGFDGFDFLAFVRASGFLGSDALPLAASLLAFFIARFEGTASCFVSAAVFDGTLSVFVLDEDATGFEEVALEEEEASMGVVGSFSLISFTTLPGSISCGSPPEQRRAPDIKWVVMAPFAFHFSLVSTAQLALALLLLSEQTPHTDPRPAGPVPTPSPRSSHAHAQSTSNTTNPRLGSMYRAVILVAGVPWERWAAPMVDAWADVHGWGNRDVGRAGLSAQIQAHHHRLPRLNASTTNFGLRRAMRRACPSAHACTPDAAASEHEHATPQRHVHVNANVNTGSLARACTECPPPRRCVYIAAAGLMPSVNAPPCALPVPTPTLRPRSPPVPTYDLCCQRPLLPVPTI
ncbi:hypothetical protein B0H13DRAFT_2438380 [Mycena leptocephala]|nr:hypothetical protein B0H13DRAFT_2438380 [Mycena leptocephala]